MSETEKTSVTKSATAPKKVKARKPAGKVVAKKASSKASSARQSSTVYNFQPRNARTANPMETFMTQKKNYDKMTEGATQAQKELAESLTKSGTILAKGFEDIFKTCMEISQSTAEKNAQAFKFLVGCKTLNEFTEAQTRATQANFDDFMSGATRLSELTVKLATDAFEPITEQVNRSIKFANSAMAA